jgi:uncharacterized protein (TIRG00374 family)
MNVAALRNRLLISMLLGIVVFALLLAYGDFRAVWNSFGEFEWWLFPIILLVTCGNYGLRFVKWEYYLRQIGVVGLRRWDSFLIYFSGLGMTVTPGKVGEWLKSYLLKEVHGTPVTRSAPILLAERLTDSLALLILCAFGVFAFAFNTWPIVAIIAVGSAIAIGVSRHRPASHAIIRFVGRLPGFHRFTGHIDEMYESTYTLMEPRGLLLMTLLSVASWSCEVVAYYLTLVGLGVSGGFDTLLKAAFILPISTLAAALAFTPGGLFVAEIGLTALSRRLLDLSKDTATASTVLIRIATLWFGVVIGLIAFAVLTRKLARRGISLDNDVRSAIAAADADSAAG